MIFGINTMSDILELLFHEPLGKWNLRQFWNIMSGIYAKYHVQIMLLFVYTTTHKGFVIFTCRYFKLSWNTTALSQSNCRNFPCSVIIAEISRVKFTYLLGWYSVLSPTDGGVNMERTEQKIRRDTVYLKWRMPYSEKIELRVARARCNWFRGCTRMYWD